jgi:hypothetical protein
MLEPGHSQVPFKVQEELLKVSYSSLFYQPLPHEVAIKTALTRLHSASL